MIAKNELATADYYLSINAYVASIRRAKYVIENIPNSSQTYRALKVLETSYEALGYVDLLDDVQNIINTNFPERGDEVKEVNSSWSWNFLKKPKRSNIFD